MEYFDWSAHQADEYEAAIAQQLEFIDALPRNATGKVLKRDLRERYVEAGAAAIS